VMATVPYRSGVATDPGLERAVNEDRVFADDARGVYLVVDGLGGHAAGEQAAEIAVRVIARELDGGDGLESAEERVRRAITAANNEIFEAAQEHPAWRGMACVLTLILIDGDRASVGHVGDSRLYLAWNGTLKKLTSDHSPVGEQEDRGELTEGDAMHHPRRNEVFRDVGSQPRNASDEDFIETKSFIFRPDAALLLSSDGLSDAITSETISGIIEHYDGDASATARMLVEAANDGGGKDNISVVFIPGPEFIGSQVKSAPSSPSRHTITRMRGASATPATMLARALLVVVGIVLGVLLTLLVQREMAPSGIAKPVASVPDSTPGQEISVDSSDSRGIINAIAAAHPGDTIKIPPGQYLGPLVLKERLALISMVPHAAVIKSDPTATANSGIAIVARNVRGARVQGLRIVGDETHPLRVGIYALDSSVQLQDVQISGAIDSDVRIEDLSSTHAQ
jgi:PPM family protein phosphatase